MSRLHGTANYIWSQKDVLGQGATGAVFRGRHKKSGELHAIKTFNQMSQLRPLDVQLREFEVLKKLRHENIVRLLAVEEESTSHDKVLVMQLCTGGSLYNLLDRPENAHGLPEEDFFHVLHDVAAGMKHLRDNGIVHRDIKPGNIMKFEEPETGRFIYKLIDFGAARELEDDGEFMSLYGTEEYLHPDLYQRAVLRRPMSKKQFGVGVDLWSLGVTFYHAATGHLPFRPFGGRKNKDMMYKITTEKESGVISGVQHTEGGDIAWSRCLPDTSSLSQGGRDVVTPLLAGLMECDTRRMLDFAQFFAFVRHMLGLRCVHAFCPATATLRHIYLDADDSVSVLKERLSEQSGIRTQYLLHKNLPVDPAAELPSTTPHAPLFLYHILRDTPERLPDPDTGKMPVLSMQPQLEADVAVAKQVAGVVSLIKRRVEETTKAQGLFDQAASMFSLVLGRDLERCRERVLEFVKRVEETGKRVTFFTESNTATLQMLSHFRRLVGADFAYSLEESRAELARLSENHQDVFRSVWETSQQVQQQVEESQRALDNHEVAWRYEGHCKRPHQCLTKADYHVRSCKQTLDDFRRDRSMKELSYNEEQIHKFDKSRLGLSGNKVSVLFRGHCFKNTRDVFAKFMKWYNMEIIFKDWWGESSWIAKSSALLMINKSSPLPSKSFNVMCRLWHKLDDTERAIRRVTDNLDAVIDKLDESQTLQQSSLGGVLSRLETAEPGAGLTGSLEPTLSIDTTLIKELHQRLQLVKAESAAVQRAVLQNGSLLKEVQSSNREGNIEDTRQFDVT